MKKLLTLLAVLALTGTCFAFYPARVEKTGQTTSYIAGDDGKLHKGVPWPDPRFTDNLNGTVSDNLTGLIWLKNANCEVFFDGDTAGKNPRGWNSAIAAANKLQSGFCGLTDGSQKGEWSLPNVKQLLSLIDYSQHNNALPPGHPFIIPESAYFSSTTWMLRHDYAWAVYLTSGQAVYIPKKSGGIRVWAVKRSIAQ